MHHASLLPSEHVRRSFSSSTANWTWASLFVSSLNAAESDPCLWCPYIWIERSLKDALFTFNLKLVPLSFLRARMTCFLEEKLASAGNIGIELNNFLESRRWTEPTVRTRFQNTSNQNFKDNCRSQNRLLNARKTFLKKRCAHAACLCHIAMLRSQLFKQMWPYGSRQLMDL